MAKRKRATPPGTLLAAPVGVRTPGQVFVYDQDTLISERSVDDASQILDDAVPDHAVRWLNIDGVLDGELLARIGTQLGIPKLQLEDIQNTAHRPKLDEFDAGMLIIAKMIRVISGTTQFEQVSVVLVGNTVVSFQERPGDVFDAIRDRIRSGKGLVRSMGAVYLAAILLDTIVDATFDAVETCQLGVEEIEIKIATGAATDVSADVFSLRTTAVELRRAIWPLREVSERLVAREDTTPDNQVRPFEVNIHDHAIALSEHIDALRDQTLALVQYHSAAIAAQQNAS